MLASYDPRKPINVAKTQQAGSLDFNDKVTQDLRALERNWREMKDSSVDLLRIVNNPVTCAIMAAGGYQEKLFSLRRGSSTEDLVLVVSWAVALGQRDVILLVPILLQRHHGSSGSWTILWEDAWSPGTEATWLYGYSGQLF